MRLRTRTQLVTLSIGLILGLMVFVLCHFEAWKNREITLAERVIFDIPEGSSFQRIANDLHDLGLIDNPYYLRLHAWLSDISTSIQAGRYEFDDSETIGSILAKLVAGEVMSYSVTLPEGGTFADFKSILAQAPALINDLQQIEVSTAMDALGLTTNSDWVLNSHGEGWFFPSTYFYEANDQASTILVRAHSEQMLDRLETVWNEHQQSDKIKSPYELLTLASIVEMESSLADDRKRISGVFVRRLQKNMRLQADPTVIYGLGDEFTGNLTRVHLRTDDSYNTYTRNGLPPTPICSPSQISLEAAAHPADGDELYFVSRGDGTSEFSRTLREHNLAVKKYQKLPQN